MQILCLKSRRVFLISVQVAVVVLTGQACTKFNESGVPGLSGRSRSSVFLSSAGSGTVRFADGQMSGECLSGNYSIVNRNCTGTDGDAYGGEEGLQRASDASAPGDTILVRAFNGSYLGYGEGNYYRAIVPKSGIAIGEMCTPSSHAHCTKIHGYGSEIPTVRRFSESQYVYIRNFRADAENVEHSLPIMGVRYSVLENVEVMRGGAMGMAGLSHSMFLNLNVHHNGFNSEVVGLAFCTYGQCHGVYTYSDGGHNIFDGGEYHHNSGYGIHCYPGPTGCENTIIRNLRVHHNGAGGMIVFGGSGARIHNVVVDKNGYGFVEGANPPAGGAGWNFGGGFPGMNIISGADVYNVTAVNNSGPEIIMSDSNQSVRNTIAIPHGITFNGAAQSHNITSGNPSDYFVDAGGADFRLLPGSGSAIDRGTTAIGNGIVVSDYTGSAPDVGAFEYGGGGPAATPTPAPVSTGNAKICVSATQVSPGATVTVNISGGNSNPFEWVALYLAANPDPSWSYNGIWWFMNGTKTPPSSGVSSATLTFMMPSEPGTYNFRYFARDGYETRLAISENITVSGQQTGPNTGLDATAPSVTVVSPTGSAVVKRSRQ